MTARMNRVPRYAPMWRATQPTVHPTEPAPLADVLELPRRVTPTCPPCRMDETCRQGRCQTAQAEADRRIREATDRYGTPTTRRFARSTREAFADERAAAVERPAPRKWFRDPWEVALAGAFAAVFFSVFGWHWLARWIGGAA